MKEIDEVNVLQEESDNEIKDLFKSEENQINKLMNEIDDLYNETKDYFNTVLNSRARGSLNFIQAQTTNLLSMKNTKLSLVKELINIKKVSTELDHKINNAADGNLSSKDALLIKKFLESSEKTNSNKSLLEDGEYADEEIDETFDDSSDLDNRLQELTANNQITYSENDLAMKYENKNIRIVVYIENEYKQDNWEFLAIDKDYNVIEDYPLPDKSLFNITFIKVKNDLIAKDQNEREYEVVVE